MTLLVVAAVAALLVGVLVGFWWATSRTTRTLAAMTDVQLHRLGERVAQRRSEN